MSKRALEKYRTSQLNAILVFILGLVILLVGSYFSILLGFIGGFMLFIGIFLYLQLDKPKEAPHGNAPSPLCPSCKEPLIWYEDAGRYYCRKCVRWFAE